MKKHYLLLVAMVFGGGSLFAQSSFSKTITTGQPAALVADAGSDIDEPQGTSVALGDTAAGVASGGTTPYSYSWDPATGLDDATKANPVATVGSANQTYTLTVTDGNNCTATDAMELTVQGLSVLEFGTTQVKLFPVPTESILFIESSEALQGLKVHDLSGKVLKSLDLSSGLNRIDLSDLPAAIYQVEISGAGYVKSTNIVVR
jgi:hypothetical protein